MKNEIVLSRIYGRSIGMVGSVFILACIVCNWPLQTTIQAVLACLLIAAPVTICVHFVLWLCGKVHVDTGFAWMLLLAALPPLHLITAKFLAVYVPGQTIFVLVVGLLSAYAAVLSHGPSISQLLKTPTDETSKS